VNCCACERVSGATCGLTVTRFALETVTAIDAELLPPAPVQVNEKLVVTESGLVEVRSLVSLTPFQPPEAVHVLALVELQTSVVVVPGPIVIGVAVKVTVGCGVVVVFEPVVAAPRETAETAVALARRGPIVNATDVAAKKIAATSLPIHRHETVVI
jgi:hypothetical protein